MESKGRNHVRFLKVSMTSPRSLLSWSKHIPEPLGTSLETSNWGKKWATTRTLGECSLRNVAAHLHSLGDLTSTSSLSRRRRWFTMWNVFERPKKQPQHLAWCQARWRYHVLHKAFRQWISLWCKVMLCIAQKIFFYQVGQDTFAEESFHEFTTDWSKSDQSIIGSVVFRAYLINGRCWFSFPVSGYTAHFQKLGHRSSNNWSKALQQLRVYLVRSSWLMDGGPLMMWLHHLNPCGYVGYVEGLDTNLRKLKEDCHIWKQMRRIH